MKFDRYRLLLPIFVSDRIIIATPFGSSNDQNSILKDIRLKELDIIVKFGRNRHVATLIGGDSGDCCYTLCQRQSDYCYSPRQRQSNQASSYTQLSRILKLLLRLEK